MTNTEKQTLIAIINGLTRVKGATQYDCGEKYINEDGIKILKTAIQNMPSSC